MVSRIYFSSTFEKELKNAPKKIALAFRVRIDIFIDTPNAKILNNHALKGKLAGYRSINISGDWRALYSLSKDGVNINVRFETIGTHSQLYK